jgi:hypothetical protein
MERSPEADKDDPCVEDGVAGDVNEALVPERPQEAQQLAADVQPTPAEANQRDRREDDDGITLSTTSFPDVRGRRESPDRRGVRGTS